MFISNTDLKKFWFGAYSFRETDGWLQAFQHTDAQMEYFRAANDFWYGRSMASSAKTIELITDATRISFDYKLVWAGSLDTIELMVNGLVTHIVYLKDAGSEGRLEFDLPAGEKKAVIYLPTDSAAVIRGFEINGTARPPEKNEKVLWLGDSITQGYGPLRSAHTYVSAANRILNYDIINQGIGGYVYDKNSLMRMDGWRPDKIIVALGTNQYFSETMKDVEEYYDALTALYGDDTPVLCVSPIWRGDSPDTFPIFEKFCENIRKIAGSHKNVTVVDGFTLVPHLSEYYLDKLHPNCLGAEIYGRNLAAAIRAAGF